MRQHTEVLQEISSEDEVEPEEVIFTSGKKNGNVGEGFCKFPEHMFPFVFHNFFGHSQLPLYNPLSFT